MGLRVRLGPPFLAPLGPRYEQTQVHRAFLWQRNSVVSRYICFRMSSEFRFAPSDVGRWQSTRLRWMRLTSLWTRFLKEAPKSGLVGVLRQPGVRVDGLRVWLRGSGLDNVERMSAGSLRWMSCRSFPISSWCSCGLRVYLPTFYLFHVHHFELLGELARALIRPPRGARTGPCT